MIVMVTEEEPVEGAFELVNKHLIRSGLAVFQLIQKNVFSTHADGCLR
jgi:hypothetical protein